MKGVTYNNVVMEDKQKEDDTRVINSPWMGFSLKPKKYSHNTQVFI